MHDGYTHTPGAWHPVLAGAAAGATAGIVAALVSLPARSPDEIVANSLTVTIVAIAIGLISGWLWGRLRAASGGMRTFAWAMGAGLVVALSAIAVVDRAVLDNTLRYAVPLAAIIFLSVGMLTPVYARIVGRPWIGLALVAFALVVGVALFGRGNVASGELTLDDVTTTSATPRTTTPGETSSTTTPTTTVPAVTGTVTVPDDLATLYTVTSGIVTYAVNERLQGLESVGVGRTESISGSFEPEGPFVFTIDLQGFTSDQSRRDSRVRGWFADFPIGMFSGSSFDLPSVTTVGEASTFEIEGLLTINDISLPATWTIEARLEPTGSISVTGEVFIVLSVFDIPVLSGGFVTMEDAATIEVAFSASPAG